MPPGSTCCACLCPTPDVLGAPLAGSLPQLRLLPRSLLVNLVPLRSTVQATQRSPWRASLSVRLPVLEQAASGDTRKALSALLVRLRAPSPGGWKCEVPGAAGARYGPHPLPITPDPPTPISAPGCELRRGRAGGTGGWFSPDWEASLAVFFRKDTEPGAITPGARGWQAQGWGLHPS